MKELRIALYKDAHGRGLMDVYAPVERRKCGSKSVKQKHIEDAWELVRAIQEKWEVPRVLLRNGKRSRCEWLRSQEKVGVCSQEKAGGVEEGAEGYGLRAAGCSKDQWKGAKSEHTAGVELQDEVDGGGASGCSSRGGAVLYSRWRSGV